MAALARLHIAACLAALLTGASAAGAADLGGLDTNAAVASNGGMVIELGAGGRIQPVYEGSDEYEVSPFPIISLDYLNIPGLFEIGERDGRGEGLSIGPSFGYIGERSPGDYAELRGLSTVDATYEAGVQVSYEWTNVEIYGAARYAFGGAEGLIGEAGVNLIARPLPQVELKAGPVVSFASSDYMSTYFGVTQFESDRSLGALRPYDPDGGFKSAGLSAAARYEFTPTWFLNADASWSRFVGDAKDSPIVDVGSDDQFTFGLGVSKKFSIDF